MRYLWMAILLLSRCDVVYGAEVTNVSQSPVSRSYFCKAVKDIEPVGLIPAVSSDTAHVYYYTELEGYDGDYITHEWTNDAGKILFSKKLSVGDSARCRTWSAKTIYPTYSGYLTVITKDADGNIVTRYSIAIGSRKVRVKK